MQKIVSIKCPKCNNKNSFYRYGKDKDGYQRYLCRKCNHQFAPDRPVSKKVPKYPRCPVCGKATFLHHDYEYYSNYRCCDKKCNHSMFVPKPNNILPA
ncbi:MAG: IS6 family transposase, partial [Epulopiscium sp.]|nr:IS6 family transposase [Candidatus Epulonipiscium sp.]